MTGKKPLGERKHAANPAVAAAREHYATRASRRTVRQAWDPVYGWLKWDPVYGWLTADGAVPVR